MSRPMDVTAADAATWLNATDAPTVLDVRTPAEFASSHMTAAVNVPLSLLEEHADEITPRLRGDVLLVCASGHRARTAAQRLAPALGERVHVLFGGMSAWEQAGQPTEGNGSGVWALDRQVRTVAGSIVLASVLTSLARPRARFVAGGIGAGLLWSGLSNTCAMGEMLAKMPWNRGHEEPTLDGVTRRLATTR